MSTKATFTITGDIEAFDRIDNLYRAFRREGAKLLKNWEIKIEAEYEEKEGETEQP